MEVYPESVGQYSGLNDNNDNEIYENDAVSVYSDRVNGVVKFQNAMFDVIEEGGNISYLAEHKDNIKVIGNIYETHELLKK
ncbi:YopX family protein [Lysinibacillus sp. NPDC086135]|uniref:YopX family protein n=1 Tax=Lysinibacillus sp. NPDC086135 TaxID=3364130 RepID=UPI00380375B2